VGHEKCATLFWTVILMFLRGFFYTSDINGKKNEAVMEQLHNLQLYFNCFYTT